MSYTQIRKEDKKLISGFFSVHLDFMKLKKKPTSVTRKSFSRLWSTGFIKPSNHQVIKKTTSEWLENDKFACSFREIHFAVNIDVLNKQKKKSIKNYPVNTC